MTVEINLSEKVVLSHEEFKALVSVKFWAEQTLALDTDFAKEKLQQSLKRHDVVLDNEK